ncbi:MAG: hypothetical protein KGO96_12225 [Elusimicrobia bacterium]|nr:hypothetical protein [Elusimicrobiota bacterium]
MSQAAAPALGFSIVANLGDNRQITCQCFVDVTEELPAIHQRIDLVQAVIDRQQAKYQVKDHRAELEKHKQAYQRLQDDLNSVELRFQQEKDAGGARLLEIAKAMGESMSASNRRALEAEKAGLVAKLEANEAERKAHLSNVLVSKERFEEEMDRLSAKIADCEALIGGE